MFHSDDTPMTPTLPLLVALAATPAPSPDHVFLALAHEAPGLSPVVLQRALRASRAARRAGYGKKPWLLTVIDYALPTSERRLWTFDLRRRRRLFHEYVAHGKGSGGERAERFSNRPHSRMSSLGLFVTRGTYRGRRGYSLRLFGLEPGFNHLAQRRAIVMHGAPYMTEAHKKTNGGLFGQSWGCPALDERVARPVIDEIKGGSFLFIHFPDEEWLARSRWLGPNPPQRRRSGGADHAP